MLTRISSLLANHGLGSGAFVYVADSAMVTGSNLKALGSTRFISRLPATYDACKNAVAEAVDARNWVTLGSLTELPVVESRSNAEYKAYETKVVLPNIPYRAVVVNSNAYDKRRQKRLERSITCSVEVIAKKFKHVQKIYFCEADARKA
jgi:transposase